MASTTAVASLTTATTGDGSTVDFATAKRNVSVVVRPDGTVSGGVVAIEVSHDGTNWVRLVVMHLSLRPGIHSHNFYVGAYRYWRAVIADSVKGGGNVSATFMESDG